ncbi:hypothetical protein HaLaN_30695, partial [Haematococcus lacustris]
MPVHRTANKHWCSASFQAATFFATSPYAVVATLTQLLGCPTACQQ